MNITPLLEACRNAKTALETPDPKKIKGLLLAGKITPIEADLICDEMEAALNRIATDLDKQVAELAEQYRPETDEHQELVDHGWCPDCDGPLSSVGFLGQIQWMRCIYCDHAWSRISKAKRR